MRRYCSKVWLAHSVCPSPSGWYPEVKWRHMSSALPSERKKCETNSEPRSDVTCEGTPCLEKTLSKKSFASSGDVMVSWVGTNIACFERRSMMTRIAV